jgi:hypothetical protein
MSEDVDGDVDGRDPFIEDDAAYVMGALSDDDRRAFEAHLPGCQACTRSVAELSQMPTLLDRVPLERVLQPQSHREQPPELLLPRLLTAARTQRRRRAAGLVASGAVAASVIALAVTAGVLGLDSTEPAGTSIAMAPARTTAVAGTLEITPVDWGTRITLNCTWLDHAKPAYPDVKKVYRLVAVPRDGGEPQVLAQWAVVPGQDATVTGSTDLAPKDIAEIEMTAASTQQVLLRAESVDQSPA